MKAAATVTCSSQSGASETVLNGTCSVGSGANSLSYTGYTESFAVGNTFVALAFAGVTQTPVGNPAGYPLIGSANWDDVFDLPTSNPNDIYKITVTGGGLDHPAWIDAGPIWYGSQQFCDGHYVGNPVCTEKATVTAGELSSIELGGSDSVEISGPCGFTNCGLSVNSDLLEMVTVQRFLSDGTTADPFTVTPEPSSLALLLLGVPAAGFALRRRS